MPPRDNLSSCADRKEITIIDKITDRVDAKRIERAIDNSLNTPEEPVNHGVV